MPLNIIHKILALVKRLYNRSVIFVWFFAIFIFPSCISVGKLGDHGKNQPACALD